MAIEAIGAMASRGGAEQTQLARMAAAQESTPAQSDATTISMRASGDSQGSQPGFASELGDRVYQTIDNVGAKLPQFTPSADSQVAKAKEDLSPASEAISANGPKGAATGEQGLVNLSKAFDHAVFMASVNQVISGVSDTARTLIRQT